jgi:hypothetical protein
MNILKILIIISSNQMKKKKIDYIMHFRILNFFSVNYTFSSENGLKYLLKL